MVGSTLVNAVGPTPSLDISHFRMQVADRGMHRKAEADIETTQRLIHLEQDGMVDDATAHHALATRELGQATHAQTAPEL